MFNYRRVIHLNFRIDLKFCDTSIQDVLPRRFNANDLHIQVANDQADQQRTLGAANSLDMFHARLFHLVVEAFGVAPGSNVELILKENMEGRAWNLWLQMS